MANPKFPPPLTATWIGYVGVKRKEDDACMERRLLVLVLLLLLVERETSNPDTNITETKNKSSRILLLLLEVLLFLGKDGNILRDTPSCCDKVIILIFFSSWPSPCVIYKPIDN